jgi:predicted transposase YbfD/YdcC
VNGYKLPNGIPSHDTFGRVFSILQPDGLRVAFANFVREVVESLDRERIGRQVVAIDGKTMRRSFDAVRDQPPTHMVSAWDAKHGVVLGQVSTEVKSNEITAIPELLDLLHLEKTIITIDAMGCQRAIAKRIIEGGGDYILAVKSNQPTLHEDAKRVFDDALARGLPPDAWSSYFTEESGHGRDEIRKAYVTSDLSGIADKGAWRGMKSLVVLERQRVTGAKTSHEDHFYISSLKYKAPAMATAVRAHWEVENSLHWVMDMAFREDECRVRTGHAAENLGIIRHLALNLLRKGPTQRVGIKGRRLMAAMDDDYMMEVLCCNQP